MDTSEIKRLIEAFYNGETSADEEQILFDYFNSTDVAEDLTGEKNIFLQMNEKDNIYVPATLESRLDNLIDELVHKEELEKQSKKKYLWIQAGSIAAGIALLIFAGIHFTGGQNNVKPTLANNVELDDQQKIEEAQKALILLSSNFNKGMNQVSMVSTNLDKANEILDRTFNRKNDKEL